MPLHSKPHALTFFPASNRTTVDDVIEGTDIAEVGFVVDGLLYPQSITDPRYTPWNVIVDRGHVFMYDIPAPGSPAAAIAIGDAVTRGTRSFTVQGTRVMDATVLACHAQVLLQEIV